MTQAITPTAGIDTSKDKLDVAIHGRKATAQFANTEPGWTSLAAHLDEFGIERVGIEATGGYERGVTRFLQARGLVVVVLQPLQVKAYAKMHLKRAKNDRLDAILIADCTVSMDARDAMPPDPRFDALSDHLTFIEQTEQDIARIKTRMEHIADPRLRDLAAADIVRLRGRRREEMARLEAELRVHADLGKRLDLVLSVPGLGLRTALAVVVRMPELGLVSRERVAALAGLAPYVRDSGKQIGEMHIGGGRGRLRRSLYTAALPAAYRWNHALMALYGRLRGRGKAHTCALVACARKLLVYANTVVQRGTPWEEQRTTS
jgi:transposase